jgi:hypothetical protein
VADFCPRVVGQTSAGRREKLSSAEELLAEQLHERSELRAARAARGEPSFCERYPVFGPAGAAGGSGGESGSSDDGRASKSVLAVVAAESAANAPPQSAAESAEEVDLAAWLWYLDALEGGRSASTRETRAVGGCPLRSWQELAQQEAWWTRFLRRADQRIILPSIYCLKDLAP